MPFNLGVPEIIIMAIICIPIIAGVIGIIFAVRSRKKPPALLTCPRCGAANPGGSKFCNNCGVNLVLP
jgi:hypothetical protein